MAGHDTQLPLDQADIDAFQRDGAICLRGVIDDETIDALREAVAWSIEHPGPYSQDLTNGQKGGAYFADIFCWTRCDAYRAHIVNPAMAAIAGQLLDAARIRFYVDHLLVMEPGSSEPTPWHQDYPYWPMEGSGSCSIWLALDPVNKESGAVEFVAGSHRIGDIYAPRSFQAEEQLEDGALARIPDIDANRDHYSILSWDMVPGDVTVHHCLTVHGSPGNTRQDQRRRGLAVRFMDDSAKYRARDAVPVVMRKAFAELAPELRDGGPFDARIFPELWSAAG